MIKNIFSQLRENYTLGQEPTIFADELKKKKKQPDIPDIFLVLLEERYSVIVKTRNSSNRISFQALIELISQIWHVQF